MPTGPFCPALGATGLCPLSGVRGEICADNSGKYTVIFRVSSVARLVISRYSSVFRFGSSVYVTAFIKLLQT